MSLVEMFSELPSRRRCCCEGQGAMAVQQSHPLAPLPPVSWRFSPLPTRIFGLLPDACSSESSDTELEQKQGLQEIEEERKLRQQQQYEEYRSFLEEQKQHFYLQQEAQRYEEKEEYMNGYVQEECDRKGRFQKVLNEYDQEQECVQSQSAQKYNLSERVEEQERFNLHGCTPEHETYHVNGYFQEQPEHIQEYQLTSDKDLYQHSEQQYVGEEPKCLEVGEGCSQRVEQCCSTGREEGVPPEQAELVGQQQAAGEGGRLFCVVGTTGSRCAAMSTLAGSSEGEYLTMRQPAAQKTLLWGSCVYLLKRLFDKMRYFNLEQNFSLK
jgi:hypothetical protein